MNLQIIDWNMIIGLTTVTTFLYWAIRNGRQDVDSKFHRIEELLNDISQRVAFLEAEKKSQEAGEEVKDSLGNPIPLPRWQHYVEEFATSWKIPYEEAERFHRDMFLDLMESCKNMEKK